MRKYLITFTVTVAIWELVTVCHLVNPMFLPRPWETLNEGIRLIGEKKIFMDAGYSLYRIMSGVLLAFGVGIPLGILLGYFGKFYTHVEPALDFLRSIPPIIVFPLALMVFGTGDQSRIAVIVFGCVLIVVLNAALGVMNGNRVRIRVAQIMGARWYQILFRVVFFDALPQIFIGVRVALSMGVIIGIVTEMLVGARYGLGSRVVYAQTAYETPEMYFVIILVGSIGFLMNKGLGMMERKIVHWN